jgi:hypothetical protein
MAANATTKIQVSYGKDGSLVNIYADNAAELETLLSSVQDSALLIEAVGVSLGRPNVAPNGGGAVAYAKKVLGATEVAPPAGNAPDCKHGAMSFRSGQGSKGPWKGWMCSGPKELPKDQKCDTVWIR